MAEPTTSTAAGAAAGWKLIGGLAGAGAIGAALAAVVVMCMTLPKNAREWAVALVSTVMSSVCGGAVVILRFDLLSYVKADASKEQVFVTLIMILGLVFACGLPGWLIVRAAFRWMDLRKDKDLGELLDEMKQKVKP
jgi:hypothetical protein